MPITLQSTVGGFNEDFMKALPQLEQSMALLGLDPDDFIISKSTAQFMIPGASASGGEWDYTVFIDGESFTVTRSSDLAFLEYFYALCRNSVNPSLD